MAFSMRQVLHKIRSIFSHHKRLHFLVLALEVAGLFGLKTNAVSYGELSSSKAPDLSKIAFVSMRDGNSQLYLMNADGVNPARLTNNNFLDTNPVFSPIGSLIAFTRSGQDGKSWIYLRSGSGVEVKLPGTGDHEKEPAFSPDGKKIAFSSIRECCGQHHAKSEIYLINIGGGGLSRLTSIKGASSVEPAFSPDGELIVFASYHGDLADIYTYEIGEREVHQLTMNQGKNFNPVFSPDGSKIAFTSDRNGNAEVYMMNADGSDQKNISNNDKGDDIQPAFSADGSEIAFASNRDGNYEVYEMNVDGNNQRRLTDDPADDTDPTFGQF